MPRIPCGKAVRRAWIAPPYIRHPTRNATPRLALAPEASRAAKRSPPERKWSRHFSSSNRKRFPILWNSARPCVSLARRRQRVRDVFARVWPAADGHDDVLFAVDHIGHRRSGLRGRHIDRADFFAGSLVVGTEHRAAWMIRRRSDISFAGDDQRFGDECPDVVSCLTGARNAHAFENLRIPYDVGCLAVRNLPDEFSFVEIDGGNRSVRRLD